VDRLWDGLIAGGGEPSQCGWLKDRFGLSWQIVPRVLDTLLQDPDPARAGRAMQAMLGMQKLDVAALLAAADG
jgi:predicted 3-demethylubiquinone-9 3-methyltransferase (glyoxalase superfamily)